MNFTELEIYNFRSINFIKLSNIKQINLLTGRNNCGKTSILEAIFLLSGMSNPQLAIKIHQFRNLDLSEDEDFSYLFPNSQFSQYPKITGQLNSQARTLQIKPIYNGFTNHYEPVSEKLEFKQDNFISNASSTEDTTQIEGIQFNYGIDDQENFQSSIKLKQREMMIPHNYRENLSAIFLSPNTIIANLGKRLEKAIIRKKTDIIIRALQEVEPNLTDIRMGDKGVVYADIGIENLVPLNIMGDGVIRILSILSSISENQNGILIIDEIENGFHYSSLSVLWKAVLRMAFESNVQLFIVTHSYECIEAFVNAYQEIKSELEEDFISLFRIEHNHKGEHKSFQYKADTLFAGVEKEFEVR